MSTPAAQGRLRPRSAYAGSHPSADAESESELLRDVADDRVVRDLAS